MSKNTEVSLKAQCGSQVFVTVIRHENKISNLDYFCLLWQGMEIYGSQAACGPRDFLMAETVRY